jgi:hypothetical protein
MGIIINKKAVARRVKELLVCLMISSWITELYLNIPFVGKDYSGTGISTGT